MRSLLAIVTIIASTFPAPSAVAQSRSVVLYVAPGGNDANTGAARSPFASIQHAINVAPAGATIQLADGIYEESVFFPVAKARLTLRGSRRAILHRGGNHRVIWIQSSDISLIGFSIDGLRPSEDAADRKNYADTAVLVQSVTAGKPTRRIRILGLHVKRLRGECIRIKDLAEDVLVSGNTVIDCGMDDYVFGGGGKNGEGIYIGTAPEQVEEKNTHKQPDETKRVIVRGNFIRTNGNECVDIKEAARDNIIEGNYCTGQLDPNSGGFGSRGDANIFRRNVIVDVVGAGIRFGGDEETQGINNVAMNNTITRAQGGGIRYQRAPQGEQCGNILVDAKPASSGDFRDEFDPASPC
jgi:hypothetical protein